MVGGARRGATIAIGAARMPNAVDGAKSPPMARPLRECRGSLAPGQSAGGDAARFIGTA